MIFSENLIQAEIEPMRQAVVSAPRSNHCATSRSILFGSDNCVVQLRKAPSENKPRTQHTLYIVYSRALSLVHGLISHIELEPYLLTLSYTYRITLCKFSVSDNKLPIELGRHSNIPIKGWYKEYTI